MRAFALPWGGGLTEEGGVAEPRRLSFRGPRVIVECQRSDFVGGTERSPACVVSGASARSPLDLLGVCHFVGPVSRSE